MQTRMKVYLATAEVLVVKRKFYTATFGVLVAVLRRKRLEQIKSCLRYRSRYQGKAFDDRVVRPFLAKPADQVR